MGKLGTAEMVLEGGKGLGESMVLGLGWISNLGCWIYPPSLLIGIGSGSGSGSGKEYEKEGSARGAP